MTAQVQIQLGGGANPAANITITEVSAGVFKFDVVQTGAVIGDLRGLFFDVKTESALTGGTVSGLTATNQSGAAITLPTAAVATGNDTVTKVGGSDTSMNGALAFNGRGAEASGYDVGIEFGTAGIGKDDVGSVSFTLNLGKVTLADLAGQDFGLRMTSVGALGSARDASVKLTGASFAVAADADEQLGARIEDSTFSGDAVADRIANTDGGAVQQTLTWASLDGGATRIAIGTPQPIGATGATITINADGTYLIDAQGADALAAGEQVAVVLTYGVNQTYYDAAGARVGALAETSAVRFTLTGTNDAPVVSAPLSAAANEDAAAVSVDALAGASDVDHGAVLSVVLPATLPAGVTYDAASHSFRLNPADAAFQSLALGETQTLTVSYGVSDGLATTPTSVTFTITGANDAPTVSAALSAAATEDTAPLVVNALANAADVDRGAILSVVDLPTLPAGVSFDVASQSFRLNPADAAFQSLALGETQTLTVSYGVSDGLATTPTSITFTITGANDAPTVSAALSAAATEDTAPLVVDALANAADVDRGAILSVVDLPTLPAGVSFDVASQSFRLNPADAAFQSLALGETRTLTVSYGVSDGLATTPTSVTFTITGANDAPTVSAALSAAATEDGATLVVNALANAADVDRGAVLSVVDLPTLPAGVSFDVASQSFRLNPADAAFQSLAAGETRTLTVSYGVSDGLATTPTSVTFTITGANDAPVVTAPLSATATEDGAKVTLNALSNASDIDHGAVLTVVGLPATLPAGVTFDVATQSFTLDPTHAAFQPLAAGQTTTVTVAYGVSDGAATTPTSVSWLVTGVAEAPVAPPAPPRGDSFPTTPKDISHVTLYFEQSPGDGTVDLRTVKIDNVPTAANDDFDAWLNQSLTYIRAHDSGLTGAAQLLGAALKFATIEQYYAIDGDHDQDPVPGGVLVQSSDLDASFNYGWIFS